MKDQFMYHYHYADLKALLADILRQNLPGESWKWWEEKTASMNTSQFNSIFAVIPRKIGKSKFFITGEQQIMIQQARPGFSIQGWSVDRLARVRLLLQLDATDQANYISTIENLFRSAEMYELVALYSALPVLAYPESWTRRCAEGIRSNIGDVLEAIMCRNPYPSENLEEPAWNQLVLKAFFTDKPVHLILGLDQRVNRNLANMISDYAHERWSAQRPVNPQLWRCVGKFLDQKIFPDIERLVVSVDTLEREAACLACHDSSFPPAKELLNKNAVIKSEIESGELSWDNLAAKLLPVHF